MAVCSECNKLFTPVDDSLPPDPKDVDLDQKRPSLLTHMPYEARVYDRHGTLLVTAPIVHLDTQYDISGRMRVRLEVESVVF